MDTCSIKKISEITRSVDFSEPPVNPSLKTPERNLLYAIVERACFDLNISQSQSSEQQARKTAKRWLLSDSMDMWSYKWICEELELSPVIQIVIEIAAKQAKV